jgi:hypothetical protein
MLRLGADARRVDNDGKTALQRVGVLGSRGRGGAEVVRLLVAVGCDVRCVTTTASLLSSTHGASVMCGVRDKLGRTAVEFARGCGGDEWLRKVEGWAAAAMVSGAEREPEARAMSRTPRRKSSSSKREDQTWLKVA